MGTTNRFRAASAVVLTITLLAAAPAAWADDDLDPSLDGGTSAEGSSGLLGDLLGGGSDDADEDDAEEESGDDLLGDLLGGGDDDATSGEEGDLLEDLLGGDILGGGNELDSPWGTVLPDKPLPQSHAWLLKVDGLLVDKAVFATHYPVMPSAPKVRSGGSELIRLTAPSKVPLLPAVGLGVASGAYSKAIGNAVAGNPGQMDLPYPGAAHAEAAAASIDLGVPYISNILPGGKQLSLVGVHLEGVRVQVQSWRGRLSFSGMGPVAGYISMLGNPLLEIKADSILQPNLGLRIPEDRSLPALAEVTLNEQVTTDLEGRPTENENGRYEFDPTATSGYANAAHVSVLGLNAIDVTVGHAAVLAEKPPKKK